MPDPLDVIVQLTGARKVGASWRARCPAHDDKTPSLTITRGSQQPVVLYDHAGCRADEIVAALGLPEDFLIREDADLPPDRDAPYVTIVSGRREQPSAPARPANGHDRSVVARHAYTVRAPWGDPVAIHDRIEYADGSKSMPWRWADGTLPTPTRPLSPTTLPLYRSETLATVDSPYVVVVEGEKAADSLASRVAIPVLATVTGAASTPVPDVLAPLRGKFVALWPDRDDVGEAHMQRVARLLDGVADHVAVIRVPALPEHGDAADWEGGQDELMDLIFEAPPALGPEPERLTQPARPPEGRPGVSPASVSSTDPPQHEGVSPPDWPVLDSAALYGVSGAIVEAVAPFTEADPAGILASWLTTVGVLLGRTRTISVAGGGVQTANLFTILVGDSATGRKGTAVGVAQTAARLAYPDLDRVIVTGLGSGEGLVTHLRREVEQAAKTGAVAEYRVLVDESEMARLLAAMGREGSTLSAILRAAFDGTALGRTVVAGGGMVTWHHVGVLGQVTPEELRERLSVSDRTNGFANRFLWVAVRRQRLVPFASSPRQHVPTEMTDFVGEAIADAAKIGQLTMSDEASDEWERAYADIGLGQARRFGTLAALTSRETTLILRLATIYALLDRTTIVSADHVRAARAVVDYSHASVRWVWRASTGDPEADSLLETLRTEGPVTWTDLRRDQGLRGAEADRVVSVLVDAGLVQVVTESSGRGRPRRLLTLVPGVQAPT